MANPNLPQDGNGINLGGGLYNNTGTAEFVLPRMHDAAVIGAEDTKSGNTGVTAQPATSGGLLTKACTSQDSGTALTSTAQEIKDTAGQLYGWFIMNPNDETCFVNLYNTADSGVTVGTTVPLFHLAIPAGAAANLIAAVGIAFGTALSASATKTAGSNTAPDVALEAVFFYK